MKQSWLDSCYTTVGDKDGKAVTRQSIQINDFLIQSEAPVNTNLFEECFSEKGIDASKLF